MRRSPILDPEAIFAFSDEARRAVYQAISLRRDVRHFQPDREVEAGALDRILGAAHQAPSVGFSQPWGFVIVRDTHIRRRIRESFLACRQAEAARFPQERRDAYLSHKLEGILEAPINVCVAVDLRDREEAILGTTAQPEAVRASACCAVENLWLAARAEGIGVGWVSIVEPAVLRAELSLPSGVEPVAYLCLGHPIAFRERPMLEETGWRARRPLDEVVHAHDRWNDVRSPSVVAHASSSPPAFSTSSFTASASTSSSFGTSASTTSASTTIPLFDETARDLARTHQRKLTKPVGSLGRLEEVAAWYAGVRGVFPPPAIDRAALAIFVADHGVVVEGVSAYGSPVTAAMTANVMAGGAAVNAIAEQARTDVLLVDVGIAGDLSGAPTAPVVPLWRAKIRAGTANLRRNVSMQRDEAEAAMSTGAEIARAAIDRGAFAIGLGEIGIGNTTSAAALVCAFTGNRPNDVVGRGTGIDDDVLARKIAVVADALELHRPDASDPIGVLAALGGLELAALVGCALEAARRRIPIVLDGVVTNAAALVAVKIEPRLRDYLLASHASPEPGARIALADLALQPLFDFGMRLGEGTGAALAIAFLRTAVNVQLSMASFATAGIVGRAGVRGAEMRESGR